MFNTLVRYVSLCIAMLLVAGAASAQGTYPSHPIRMIIPFAAGSGSDIVGRVLAQILSTQMGVAVVPETREGAGGVIGATVVAKAPPDGYTLLSAATPMTVAPYMMRTLPYDPAKDFTAVARIAVIPMVLVVSASSPYKTFDDLLTQIRSNPGKVNYATGGKGSPSHLEVELIKQIYGLRIQDIPYKSFGQGLTDTIGGRMDFAMTSLPLAQGNIMGGNLRALAIGTANRLPALPQVPTLAEALNKSGYEALVWYGLLAPAGTPPEIVSRLNDEIQKALAIPANRERIEKVGGQVSTVYGAKFGAQLKSESENWSRIVKELNLTSE